MGLGVFAKICSIIFFFAAWHFYIPPKKYDEGPQEVKTKTDKLAINATSNYNQGEGKF